MPSSPFYSTKEWKDARKKYLALHPHCQICRRIGVESRAVEVDHVIPIERGGALLAFSNLSGKCRLHHSQKTMALDMPGRGRDKLVTTGPDGFPIYVEKRHYGKKTTP
jgi:5-methylcytosine-specific restriction endonuclease McrA